MRPLGIMPFVFFCGVALYLRAARPWRDAAITSGVITGVWIVAGCELLSLSHAVAFWPLLFWWGVPIALLGWKCRTWRPAKPPFTKDWLLIGTISATVLALMLIFIQAAATPPNNWDALSYHLPRQIYWMQQRHVGLFATNDPRMLIMQPLAEYVGLHLLILSGGDHWVNLIQWFALALTALTASAIARELGCSPRLQATAALLVVAIPTAALEAANPKNDIVTAFFLCAFAFAGLKAYNSRNFSAPHIGAACGLVLLSKGTGMIFALPVAVWIGAACLRLMGIKRGLVWGAAVAMIALAINAAFLIRLTSAFGSPMGPPVGEGGSAVANTLHTPSAFLSNLARNTTMHLATGAENIDTGTTRAVTAFHKFLRLDVNDPRTTFQRGASFGVTANFSDEDRAKAPVHMALAIATFVLVIIVLCGRGDKWIGAFLLLPFLCFALFSYLMVWQEWHSRLHIPVLCLAAPTIAYSLRRVACPFAGLAFALALICIITNQAKPLFHLERAKARFRPEATVKGMEEAKRVVRERHPQVLGIAVNPNRCEYFLLTTLLHVQKTPPLLVKINNRFPHITSPHTNFDVVISWHDPPALTNEGFQATYTPLSTAGVVTVFGRK